MFGNPSLAGRQMGKTETLTQMIRAHAQAQSGRKGSYGRHIIRVVEKNGRRHELHATKGWRSYAA